MEKEEKREPVTGTDKSKVCSNLPDGITDRCPYCGIRFSNPIELIQHVFRYHNS